MWQGSAAGVATLGAAGLYVSLAAYVWWRRGGSASTALALVLLASLVWSAAYAAELGAVGLTGRQLWGDVKYVGICLLPPAWLVFVARFSGRGHWVTRRTLALLAVEPIVVLALLANSATHDLIRFYGPGAATEPAPVAQAGPLFWPHLLYVDLVLWACSAVFVATLLRASPVYRRASISLIVSQFVPWALNLLYNLHVGPFGRVDLAPFAFTACGGVLVWGMYRSRLLAIVPIARSLVFDTITDAVVVRDPLDRVVDANPAAERLLGRSLAEVIGRTLADLAPAASGDAAGELVIGAGRTARNYEQTSVPIPGWEDAVLGSLVVLRDVTEHRQTQQHLQRIDTERRVLLERLVTAQEEQRQHLATSLRHSVIQPLRAAASTLDRVRPDLDQLELQVIAYRIAQEALANARAHARAQRVAICLEAADGGIYMRVTDDGVGFLPGLGGRWPPPGDLGMISMREQAAIAGGWCRVSSAPGMGTTVELWLPTSTLDPDATSGHPAAQRQHGR